MKRTIFTLLIAVLLFNSCQQTSEKKEVDLRSGI